MDWPGYFRHNQAQRRAISWAAGVQVPPPLRAPLVRSLQRFQLGERGDGTHLKRVAAGHSLAYAAAVALFVAEEQEHAALMARVLAALGAPLLARHWSDQAFRLLCLGSGLRLELLVLLAAEIIATRYFQLLYAATDDAVLRAVCAQILQDEEGHIAFHCDTLRGALTTLPAPLCRLLYHGWHLFFAGVCRVVLYDHRRLLRAAGVAPRAFRQDCHRLFRAAACQALGAPIPGGGWRTA